MKVYFIFSLQVDIHILVKRFTLFHTSVLESPDDMGQFPIILWVAFAQEDLL